MRGLITTLITALVVLMLIRLATSTAQVRRIEQLLRSGLLSTGKDHAAIVEQMAIACVRESNSKFHINVNSEPEVGALNIYVIDSSAFSSQAKGTFVWAVGKMAYIGDPNLIVIDVESIRSILAQYDDIFQRWYQGYEGTDMDSKNVLYGYLPAMLQWIIGHEIGHIALDHRPSHFGQDDLLASHGFDRLSHEQESAADAFSMHSLPLSKRFDLENALIQLFNAEFERKNGPVEQHMQGLHFSGDIGYLRKGTHPDFIYRILRALEVSSTQNGQSSALIQEGLDSLRESED